MGNYFLDTQYEYCGAQGEYELHRLVKEEGQEYEIKSQIRRGHPLGMLTRHSALCFWMSAYCFFMSYLSFFFGGGGLFFFVCFSGWIFFLSFAVS